MSAFLVLWIPFLAQAALMGVDELHYHRRRGLPTWEIWSHPCDTLSTLGCILYLLGNEPSVPAVKAYAALAVISALLATKDEFVHLAECGPGEQWVHSVLFLLHPTVFVCSGLWWWNGLPASFLQVQAAAILLVLAYQVGYWAVPRLRRGRASR